MLLSFKQQKTTRTGTYQTKKKTIDTSSSCHHKEQQRHSRPNFTFYYGNLYLYLCLIFQQRPIPFEGRNNTAKKIRKVGKNPTVIQPQKLQYTELQFMTTTTKHNNSLF